MAVPLTHHLYTIINQSGVVAHVRVEQLDDVQAEVALQPLDVPVAAVENPHDQVREHLSVNGLSICIRFVPAQGANGYTRTVCQTVSVCPSSRGKGWRTHDARKTEISDLAHHVTSRSRGRGHTVTNSSRTSHCTLTWPSVYRNRRTHFCEGRFQCGPSTLNC
jgi:hypothetical protein